MDEATREAFLKEEYLKLQDSIERFDERAVNIKQWGVTASLTAAGGAFVAHAPFLILVGGCLALLFWQLEAYWKTMQGSFYPRCAEIEEFFEGRNRNAIPMQMGKSWEQTWHRKGRWKRVTRKMFTAHVALPLAWLFVFEVLGYLVILFEGIAV